MKQTIFIQCRMFDKIQMVQLLTEDCIIESIPAEMDDIPYVILALSKKYNCNMVNIKGAKIYTKGIQKRTVEAEIETYQTNTLQFNLIR